MKSSYQTAKSTPVQLSMFNPETSQDSPKRIFFVASLGGQEHCASPDGQMIEKSGVGLARASRSQRPAKVKGSMMNGTYGPIFIDSSVLAARELSSGNKLQARSLSERLGERLIQNLRSGSMEFDLTWKVHTTSLGLRIYRLRASMRRTSGKDCGGVGWPTTTVNDATGSQYAYSQGNHDKPVLKLPGAVNLAGWPTPNAMEGGQMSRGGDRKDEPLMGGIVKLCGWASPRSTDAKCGHNYTENCEGKDLAKDASMAGWATPSSRDWKDTPGMATMGVNPDGSERSRLDQLPRQANLASGQTQPGTSAGTGKAGASQPVLNPFFSAYLMSFPKIWTLCGLRAMASLSRRKSKAAPPSSKDTETPSCPSWQPSL